ncbi:MAG: MGH1-like glycoside hydrolase domain-containing protein [Chloroflexota bacterium]
MQVQDVLFNSILCRANRDLAEIATIIGEDPSQLREWNDQTRTALKDRCWDEEDGIYYDLDRVTGRLLKDNTIAGLHTLYGGVAPPARAHRMIEEHLLNPAEYSPRDGYLAPTTSMDSSWFNPMNYWLGPVWVSTNWMLLHGLRDYRREDLARHLRDDTLHLVAQSGFREYFNPLTGEGYGTDSFGWTAALTIDLIGDEGPLT